MRQLAYWAFLSLLLSPLTLLANDAAPPARPNIVFVMADDLGYSDLGCYGGEIPTPHIDALAANGVRFTQFYNNAVCGPSRVSLLTGLYCQQVGHTGKTWNEPTDFSRCVSFGNLLQAAGYHTMMIGKWQERELPAHHGFHRFYGPQCAGKVSYYHEVKDNPFYLDETRIELPADYYMTDAFADYAVQFTEEAVAKRDQAGNRVPFFLYLAPLAPHWPLHAREADIAPHRKRYRHTGWDEIRRQRFERQQLFDLVELSQKIAAWPAEVKPWRDDALAAWQAERMAVYAAMVTSIDRSVGRVLEVLDKAGVRDNTMVIFVSDNGAARDGGMEPTTAGFGFDAGKPNNDWRCDGVAIRPGSGPDLLPGPPDTFAGYGIAWATVSNTPWRELKATAYEGGIRTPLVISWPAGVKRPGRYARNLGHLFDLTATFLDAADVQYPAQWQGRKLLPLEGDSLLPVLDPQSHRSNSTLYWNAPKNRAVRHVQWKLVESLKTPGEWELYDLSKDGGETTNLAAKHPETVRELVARWEEWYARCQGK